jgi:hypothetical protein
MLVHERVRGVPDREDGERRREHAAPSEAVDEDAEHRAGDDADDGVRRDDEPDRPEPDVAYVVEVDEEEREDDAVPERVDEAADLQGRDRARQRWE